MGALGYTFPVCLSKHLNHCKEGYILIWQETGVLKGSYMSYFNVSDLFRHYYIYMVSCGYFLCNEEYDIKKAGSRHPIFFYLVDGKLNFDYEGTQFSAHANDIVLLNGYRPHHYYCDNHCEFIFFHFDGMNAPELIDQLIAGNGSPLFRLQNAQDIYSNINEPITKLCHQERASDAMLSTIVYSTLCMIPSTGSDSNLFIPSRVKLTEDMVSYKIIEHIDHHIGENFTVDELAAHAGLSRHYFMHLFKKETGYSPQEYASVAKINYAKLMLRTTALTISEIADRLGYSSSASFINAFRLRRGVSPNQYRKMYASKRTVENS